MSRRCGACAKVLGETSVNAMNELWHPECWVCSHCQKPFPNGTYIVYKNKPYCKSDYDWICQTCGKVITDNHVAINGDKLHPSCVKCAVCRKVVGTNHQIYNGKILCSEDYELEKKAGPIYSVPAGDHGTCTTCHKPIHYQPKVVEGLKYHDYCFCCTYCRNIISGAFKKHEGFPMCPKCEEYICATCNKVIDSEFVTMEGVKLHPYCVKCYRCGIPINARNFAKVAGKPHCDGCAKIPLH